MKKVKKVCAICGKKDGIQTHTLPHGSLDLCQSSYCFDMLCVKTQGSVPIVWVGREDYAEHELLTYEEMKGKDRALISGAREVSDYICTDSMWDDFNEGLSRSVTEFEKQVIRDTPKEELPLLIGHLKHGTDDYLAQKIKGE